MAEENTNSPQNSKLLVIEDDQYLADIYATKLKLEGFDVEIANDGKTGVEMAKKMLPELILLDILLPSMDGFSVLRALKANEETKDITVVMLTNLNSPEDVKKGMELGAVDYMVKAHYVPTDIVNKVRSILKLSEKK
jgi:DNA-binding response OmpR family regulator